jgi:hypothetical protein
LLKRWKSTCGCGKYQGNQLSNMQVSIFVLGNDYDIFEDDVLRIFVCESSCKFLDICFEDLCVNVITSFKSK